MLDKFRIRKDSWIMRHTNQQTLLHFLALSAITLTQVILNIISKNNNPVEASNSLFEISISNFYSLKLVKEKRISDFLFTYQIITILNDGGESLSC